MRCLCTSSSADGSVHKWSAVFIFVYSSAQGPTGEMKGNGYIKPSPPQDAPLVMPECIFVEVSVFF